ncbi:hypothetical protein OU5_P0015 (plasmid) [Pseudomonas mandelii JR-1]|uniref:Uncharacterized protein n=1 Tax=Pseudomonas mandelii JR-1 TaxID=1147786 RepID=A0A024EKG2_9PSED|nr:hypothetical protein OU5_P0015 [Pseudomonas mandelii JR-1]
MKKLELLGEYFAHILMGIVFFVILALASLLISVVTHWVGGFEAGTVGECMLAKSFMITL